MKRFSVLVFCVFLLFGFIGCKTEGSTVDKNSYDFNINGVSTPSPVAIIRGDNLTIDFVEVPEDKLNDASADGGTEGIKVLQLKLVSGDLVLDLAKGTSRMAIYYANKAGAFKMTSGGKTYTINMQGKGWNWIIQDPNDSTVMNSILLDGNHNPDSNYKWKIFKNGTVVWEGTAQ